MKPTFLAAVEGSVHDATGSKTDLRGFQGIRDLNLQAGLRPARSDVVHTESHGPALLVGLDVKGLV